jgi:hypothetical protein
VSVSPGHFYQKEAEVLITTMYLYLLELSPPDVNIIFVSCKDGHDRAKKTVTT